MQWRPNDNPGAVLTSKEFVKKRSQVKRQQMNSFKWSVMINKIQWEFKQRSPLWALWAMGAEVRVRGRPPPRVWRGAPGRPRGCARERRTGRSGGRECALCRAAAAAARSSGRASRPICGAMRRRTRTTSGAFAPERSWWCARPPHSLRHRHSPSLYTAEYTFKWRLVISHN